MKSKITMLISVILMLAMLCTSLASCIGNTPTETDSKSTDSSTEQENTSPESSKGTENPAESKDENESTDSTETSGTDSEDETTEAITEGPVLEGEYAELIENAHKLKNGVQAYFTDSSRDYFTMENAEMAFTYSLDSENSQLVSSLTNADGVKYITDTMDVFVRMTSGKTFFASGSTADATANLYRIGMYYYEARFEEQNFLDSPTVTEGNPLEGWKINSSASNNIAAKGENKFVLKNSSDPYMVFDNATFSADDYNMLKITIKPISGLKGVGNIYLCAGTNTSFGKDQSIAFTFNANGDTQDIYVPLYNMKNYNGEVTKLRMDIDGNTGGSFELISLTPVNLGTDKDTPYNLSICRSFYVYTDKMHHNVQFASTEITKGIAEVGLQTVIAADTVEKVIIKDASGLHNAIDDVDWETAEYVGFDIKDAGIFGYILPVHENAGKLSVVLSDGKYIIEQTRTPDKKVIMPSAEGTENANDFHLSQRIYTDSNHTFDEFVLEAEIERNPIDKYIRVSNTKFTESAYSGYDPIRGIYVINMNGPGGFNNPYYLHQNRHYTADVTICSPDERNIYLMTFLDAGALECSVILGSNNILIPIPVSVCKNFSEAGGERNLYNKDDPDYSESFFPISLTKESRYNLTIVNIYQNWGQYPLKQISSIQFRAPYYHLSTGVTESNCILPWYETKREGYLNTLPDFRAMSAPLWEGQPQRNSGGAHTWLEYTDSEGNYSATENYANYIDSYGPTYADVTMHNLSYDGKIKATYTHMEMPQTDENRTYYEIRYEVLEDISINDFKNNFTIYTVTDNEPAANADYRKLSYLNENNECVVTKHNVKNDVVKEYVLGDNCPYFSMFDMPTDASPDGYTNVAFLIYEYDLTIGGESSDANFVIINTNNRTKLSLNLEDVTLKAGDYISINAILMPWGSHESDYTDGDVNVRNVRENSLLNPIKITSETDEIIESVYLPKVKSTDGKTATFTVKGGYNNVAIRAYGFEKLTVPTLYQLVEGNWVKVELSSCNTPDTSGYYNYYDGYMIHYDGDGTYSYSFVTDLEVGEEKTFKLDLSEDVTSLPESGKYTAPNPLDMYYDASELNNIITGSGICAPKFSKIELSEDGSYLSLYANKMPESFVLLAPEPGEISGHYIVFKYRIPTTNTSKLDNFEFFYSSTSPTPVGGENIKYSSLKQDGEWHTLVIDASSFPHPSFKPNSDGKYNISYLRFDVINAANLAPNNYVDIGYFGMCDTIEEALKHAATEFETLDFYNSKGEVKLNTTTGEAIDPPADEPDDTPIVKPGDKQYVDPSSGYTVADVPFFGVIDSIGDYKLNASGNFADGIAVISNLNATVGKTAVIGGWCAIEGGAQKYLWSADGGKTWHEPVNPSYGSASDAIINHAQGKLTNALGKSFNFKDTSAAKKNGAFQGPKLTVDLSAYAGQTVDFVFAAVPASATDTLCLLVCVENMKIAE